MTSLWRSAEGVGPGDTLGGGGGRVLADALAEAPQFVARLHFPFLKFLFLFFLFQENKEFFFLFLLFLMTHRNFWVIGKIPM